MENKKVIYIIGIVLLIGLSLSNEYYQWKWSQETRNNEVFISNQIRGIEVDYMSACYKGCQFVTQPIYNLTLQRNKSIRIQQYDLCGNKCEDFYNGSTVS